MTNQINNQSIIQSTDVIQLTLTLKMTIPQVDKLDCHLPTKLTRNSSGARTLNVRSCFFFCDDASGTLHQASTFKMDARVRKCAIQLQDRVLLAKLSESDLISQEAVYHSNFLVTLYNKAQRFSESTEGGEEKLHQGIALAQLVAYIEETRAESVDTIPVFKSDCL